MRAVGIVLAGGNSKRMRELSKKRAIAAMPVAGSFRSIDFVLSNMSNSHIQSVAVLTQYNSRSLNEHLSSSKWWDFGRKQGGLYVFPPTITAEHNDWYRGTADALYQNLDFLKRSHEPYVVIAAGDGVYKIDYNKVLEYHIEKKADITIVCKDMPAGVDVTRFGMVKTNADGRITDFEEKPMVADSTTISCGIYVIRRRQLIELLERCAVDGQYDFVKDILVRYKNLKRIYAYKLDSYWNNIASVDEKGVVKGIKEGTAKITLKTADGSSKKTVVTVKVLADAEQVRLMDDFYQSANSDILKNTELDEKVGSWSQFGNLQEKLEDKVDEIIDGLSEQSNEEGTVEDNLSDFYKTAIDTKTRDEQKLKTIQGYLDEIDKVSNLDEYVALQGRLSKEGIDGIFCTLVYNDLKNIEQYQVYFDQINTGLSDMEFSNIMCNQVKTEYTKYVKKLLELSGETKEQAEKNASDVIAFQRNVATTNIGILDAYDINNIYHKYTVEDLEKVFTNCNIRSYLQEAGYGNIQNFIVCNPEQLVRVNKYCKSSNLDMLKEYAKLNVLFQYAPYLTTEFYEAYETFDTIRNMEKENDSIEDFSKRLVQNGMKWDVSKLYVEKYVSQDTKKDIEAMVDKIVKQYNKEISNCSWMSKETKQEALKKLNKITKNISYPNDWSEYITKTQFKGTDEGGIISDNIQMLFKDREEQERNMIGTTVDKDEWLEVTPLDVNAFYMPSANSITIPIGITDGVFYDTNRTEAENLGAIGCVIGHEISHAFDAYGSQYDENGKERNWWNKSDKKKYNDILEKLDAFYDTYEVLSGVFQDGEMTLSENIADLAGVGCAVKLVDKEDRKKFFESYANVWAGEMTENVTKQYLVMDVHSNEKVRVNAVLSLLDEFYETYDVKKTDAMYVAPENRIKIW